MFWAGSTIFINALPFQREMHLLTAQNRASLHPPDSSSTFFADDLESALGAALAEPHLQRYLREQRESLVIYTVPSAAGGSHQLCLSAGTYLRVERDSQGNALCTQQGNGWREYFPELSLPVFIDGLNQALSDRLGQK